MKHNDLDRTKESNCTSTPIIHFDRGGEVGVHSIMIDSFGGPKQWRGSFAAVGLKAELGIINSLRFQDPISCPYLCYPSHWQDQLKD